MILIDEAHNILSYTSNRESETWKDYRLETFEEIIILYRMGYLFIIKVVILLIDRIFNLNCCGLFSDTPNLFLIISIGCLLI